jgi:trans-2,3-dihydro-3-hydroxyanthranilate isomerase
MQDITREMNFSESTFVFAPEQEGTDFRVRIFGRTREMDFAGHPTIGTVEVLARAGLIAPGTERVVLGEGIGPIPVELEWDGDRLAFAWMHQLAPTVGATVTDAAAVASALGLTASDIVQDLPIQEVSCGNTFLIVPVATRAAVDRVVVDGAAMRRVLDAAGVPPRGLFLYSSEPGGDDATAYSRMLGFSGFEDPATGSASGPLGSYLVHHGVVSAADAGRIISRQGVAMGRPSRIHIDIGVDPSPGADGALAISRVRVGGQTVHVGDGTILLR